MVYVHKNSVSIFSYEYTRFLMDKQHTYLQNTYYVSTTLADTPIEASRGRGVEISNTIFFFWVGYDFFGQIYLWRVVVHSPKIVNNLPRRSLIVKEKNFGSAVSEFLW